MKTLFILRHVSGAGGSTLAKELLKISEDSVECCADDYFIDWKGVYNFDCNKLNEAHNYCWEKFVENVYYNTEIIVLSNTNTSQWEFDRYKEYAENNAYKVFILTVEKWHENNNIHNVPEKTLDKQEQRLKNSIKLR